MIGLHEVVCSVCREYSYGVEEFYRLPLNWFYGILYGQGNLGEYQHEEFERIKGKHGK